eukprot:13702649-Alexandrium_andersonii.AAC.1
MKQLSNLMVNIRASGAASAATASAESGGARGAVDASGDVEMVTRGAAPAEGGGEAPEVTP